MKKLLLWAAALLSLVAVPALADLTYTQGSGTTIFDFVCFTTKHCSAHVPITSAGVEILPATAANQATEITALNSIVTNTAAAIPAGSAIIGKVGIDQTTPGTTNGIRTTAGATGGGTLTSAIAPATPAGVNLKASAGTVFRVFATTIQATPVYIKFYNSASAPTCGSGTPVGRFMVPVASTAANGAGTNIDVGDIGAAFGTGIGYCVTGALADADTTAITASNTLVNIVWN